ncbi:GNAT family N-acetyltransferase [Rhodobacterales bacterium]|nr:GNAT family N-acetyltransferase [Rhodobacterales bacterium]
MTGAIRIRRAERADAKRLNDALTSLSEELGDRHGATAEDLLRHGFGPEAAFRALLAEEEATGAVVGAIVCSPVFSTTRAASGLYVSDLWVSTDARGKGLGKRLLSAAINHMPTGWSIGFLRLAVYESNPAARAVYDRLGFISNPGETWLTLAGAPLTAVKELP